uniref:Immunoglobulin V-set domain-containing protein n=1 Tax=Castor canadensis TaxID=51338 RepID=A0A8C0ZTT1_CASCN
LDQLTTMTWSFFFLFWVAAATGVHAHVVLEQPEAELRKQGESVKVSCKTSRFTFTSYYMHWVRQRPSQGLEWMGRIDPENDKTNYAQNFQGRFTTFRDNLNNQLHLQMNSLRTEDMVLFCKKHHEGTSL